jgi:hypothetical protein
MNNGEKGEKEKHFFRDKGRRVPRCVGDVDDLEGFVAFVNCDGKCVRRARGVGDA